MSRGGGNLPLDFFGQFREMAEVLQDSFILSKVIHGFAVFCYIPIG